MEEDYSKIYEYESVGKEYAGEKACISMTSWKARINTCSKTIFSLLQQCPGFHIVLVLSKDEFPLKEKELPENLMLFVENNLIELFWIKPNLKSFKKVLFTMDKYRDVPVISADDDCIYTCNYAQMLYDEWSKHKDCVITLGEGYKALNPNRCTCPTGSKCLYSPNVFKDIGISHLFRKIIKTNNDDGYYGYILKKFNLAKIINPFPINQRKVYFFHNENGALHDTPAYKTTEVWTTIKRVIDESCK